MGMLKNEFDRLMSASREYVNSALGVVTVVLTKKRSGDGLDAEDLL